MVYTAYSLYFFIISILFLRHQFGLELLVYAENESGAHAHAHADSKKHSVVDVGLILDLNSSMGVMAESCISMAISDFYSAYPHYTTRLALHTNNSGDVLTAASAAFELLTKAEVQAIIGPQNSNEAKFVAELGGKAHVPIISFSATSSSISHAQTPYFIRTAVADTFQLKAITAIVRGFGWHEVVIIYEHTEYGNSFIPNLTDAFQEAHIQLPYMSAISINAQDFHITKELKKLMTMQTRVFLVHMSSFQLGSRLFSLADKAGMMSQGYAWIITDGLSNLLSLMDTTTIESMEGVLGLRPYSPKSKNLENFERRGESFNICGLWAYDTVWALAIAVEKIQEENSSTFLKKNVKNGDEDACGIRNLGISAVGPRLLDEILQTRFQGLSGEFKLYNGQLETPAFEIINIVGNSPNAERTIGYWTPNTGISRKLGSSLGADDEHKEYYSISIERLKKIIWPGDSTDRPKGWAIPGTGKKLRVGVPKKLGFTEFVNVQEIDGSKKYNVTGFSIDVFNAALTSLPFELEPEFVPFLNGSGESAGSYDDLVNQLCTQTYDAVVGDTTIRARRALVVDFSLPYSESGVVKVVKVEPDKLKNMWIFLMPLSWDLWLAIVVACIFVGLVLRILERRVERKHKLGTLFWFPLAALAFPERNMVANNWARFVLVVWLFTAYILMQSYTANLSSVLTVDQLTPSPDTPACAGYQAGSFVKELLLSLNFTESKLHSYSSMTEYDDALSKGCRNGGVDAIFDEIPYIKLFLHKYGSKYKMVGTTYNTGGLGFAFPSGSRLAGYFSRATLDVIENGKIQQNEKKYFGDGYHSQSYEIGEISRNSPSLTAYSFTGLFTITGFLTILALVCSECSFALTRHNYGAQNGTNDHEKDSLGPLSEHKDDSDIYNNDEDEDIVFEGDQQVIQDHNNDNDNDGDEIREI